MLSNTIPNGTVAGVVAGLRTDDATFVRRVVALADADLESASGLSAEITLQYEARMTRTDARMAIFASQTLRGLPAIREAAVRGMLSWGQVRAICYAVKVLDATGCTTFDARLGEVIPGYAHRAPDDLLGVVDALQRELRPALAQAREDRAIRGEFLSIQGRLDGGAALYGEFAAESAAIIRQRLDTEADRPVAQHDPDDVSRPQQYARALVEMCAHDAPSAGRSRPRVLATVDLDQLTERASAQILWPLPGRAPQITPATLHTLACDAVITPIITRGGRPIEVGDSYATVSNKQRDALIARDRGCRGPGCEAPVSWCDVHHLQPRSDGGATTIENMALKCRPCHRRAHRYGWKMRLLPDGALEVAIKGKTYLTYPRGAP